MMMWKNVVRECGGSGKAGVKGKGDMLHQVYYKGVYLMSQGPMR